MEIDAIESPKRILIVDDDPFIKQILVSIVESLSEHYLVDAITGGDDALTKIKQNAYDLLITDYRMPGMTGLDLAKATKFHSPNTRTILMTAYSANVLDDEGARAIFTGYVHKPFSIDQISDIVRNALEDQHKTPQILIIEDNADLNRLYSRALTRKGYSVHVALTLTDARSLLNQHHYAVLLCDIHVGQERGTDLLHEYRERFHASGTQIIMISADSQYRAFTEALGVEFYMEKPVDLDTLTTLVSRLIR